MAESQKTEAPAVDSKEKSSLLDLDIGKDFLGSWKSMSVVDDGMDFDFGPTTGGMKKAFKFDKMDMDFSLDTDFDKLSSFKIDMPALDISSPIKKSGNSKEKSKEISSGGEHRAKRDTFAFSFDFEEFADLDFDSRKTKIDDKSSKSKDKEEYSNANDSGGSRDLLDKNIDPLEDDSVSSKHRTSTSAAISTVNPKTDNIKDADPRNKEDFLTSKKDESCLLKPANTEEQEIRRPITPEKIISCSLQEPIQESHLSEKISSPEPHAQQIVHNLHGHSLAEKVTTGGAFPDVQVEEELRTAVRMVSLSAGTEQNGNAKHETELVPTRSSSSESLSQHMNSQTQEGDICKATDDHVIIGHIDDDDTSKTDACLKSLVAPEIEKLAHGEMVDKTNADSSSELCMNVLDRQSNGTKNNGLVPEKERRNISSYSKYFKRQNESESELQQASLIVNKRMSTLPNNPALEKRELDAESVESGCKLTSKSRSLPKGLSRAIPVPTHTDTDSVRGIDNNRECLNADNVKTRNETIATSVAHAIVPTKKELVSRGSNQNTEHTNALRSDHPATSIEKSKKFLSPNCLNPGLQITSTTSVSDPQNIVVKMNEMSPTKADMRPSEASPQKVSRATEPKLKTLHSMFPKGLTSMRNKDQGPESQGNMVFKRNPSIDTKKQTPSLASMRNKEQGLVLQGNMVFTRNSSADTMKHSPSTPTLKRKTYEESAEIPGSPLKRLSASPCSNNIKASVEKVDDRQACQHANVSEQKSVILDDSLIEMDISSAIENDGNFEKAEACSKELEDICNMLKKKHEEAKDILVRAIVNNNNLLMLNHPVYKDKIRMVQKFAELLMPK